MNRKFFPAKLLFVPATTLLLTALSVIPVQLLQSALAQPTPQNTPQAPQQIEPVTPGDPNNALPPPVPPVPPLPQDPDPRDGISDGGGNGGSGVTETEPEQPTTIPAAYPVRW